MSDYDLAPLYAVAIAAAGGFAMFLAFLTLALS